MIDGSGSIERYGKGNFRRCLNFVKRMVVSFKISRLHTHVAVVLFSSRPRLIFGFKKNRGLRGTLRKVGGIRYPRGGTLLGRALQYTRRYLFNSRPRKRARAVVVLTDGKSQDNPRGAAYALKRAGCLMFAVGVGRHYNLGQLRQVATSRKYVLTSGFRNLRSTVRVLKDKVCQG